PPPGLGRRTCRAWPGTVVPRLHPSPTLAERYAAGLHVTLSRIHWRDHTTFTQEPACRRRCHRRAGRGRSTRLGRHRTCHTRHRLEPDLTEARPDRRRPARDRAPHAELRDDAPGHVRRRPPHEITFG